MKIKQSSKFIKLLSLMLSLSFFIFTLSACSSQSESSGVGSIKALFILSNSDSFLSSLQAAAETAAKEQGLLMDVVVSQGDFELQISQIKEGAAANYDVIICVPVNIDTTYQLEKAAGDIPIVFVNSMPSEDLLIKDKYMYVGSSEMVSGGMQAQYILNRFSSKSELNVILLQGELTHPAAKLRTKSAMETLEASGKTINYVFLDSANWSTEEAANLFNIFLETGQPYDCVICNNDSMALGVIQACKENNISLSSLPILGIDATSDGCQAILDGDLAFTVYQSASGQGEKSVELAIALATKESAASVEGVTEDGLYVWVPFEEVDSTNVKNYMQ